MSEGKSGGWNGGAAVVPARGAGYEQTALDSRAATLLSLALRWRVERARSRLRAAEARAWEERGRLVNKILSVAERQRSGMAAELHDGPSRP